MCSHVMLSGKKSFNVETSQCHYRLGGQCVANHVTLLGLCGWRQGCVVINAGGVHKSNTSCSSISIRFLILPEFPQQKGDKKISLPSGCCGN